MNIDVKFVDSSFLRNKDSYTAVKIKGKEYIGNAKCHPDDNPSKFLGCEIAEIRATIKGFKDIKKQLVEELRQWEIFVKKCEQYKGFDKESTTARAMYRQLNRKRKEVAEISKQIEDAYSGIDSIVKNYFKVKEKLAKKD